MDSLVNLKRKVNQYKEVLDHTENYRKVWHESLKQEIMDHLKKLSEEIGLQATVEEVAEVENLEAIILSLGNVRSGMSREVAENIQRDLIKHNGSLVYQQLFNGKVIVLVNYPYIENYGQPQPPKTIAIYRPEELKEPYFQRHLETFLQEIMLWEDYDDDIEEPNQRIGFKLNFGGSDGKVPTA